MKKSKWKRLAAAVLAGAAFSCLFPAVSAGAAGKGMNLSEAYDSLQVGRSYANDPYFRENHGYEKRVTIYAMATDRGNALLEAWAEGVLGTMTGVPVFCIEADRSWSYIPDPVCHNGLEYLSQEEITHIALGLQWMEDNISRVSGNATDLYYCQECFIWTMRDDFGYRCYAEPANYGVPDLASVADGGASLNTSYAFVQEAKKYAYSHAKEYTGYAKVLDNGAQRTAVFKAVKKPGGTLALEKRSAFPELTEGNSCYSLAGAVYTLYQPGTQKAVASLKTDERGKGSVGNLPPGTYELEETAAPSGYRRDGTRQRVTIVSGQTTLVTCTDQPLYAPEGPVIGKIDAQTGKPAAQGAADLAGAQFTVEFYAGYYKAESLPEKPARTWVISTSAGSGGYAAELNQECLTGGDPFYTADNSGGAVLPLGTVRIRETKSPEGYLSEGVTWKNAEGRTEADALVLRINASGTTAAIQGGREITAADPVIRGELSFRKIDDDTGRPMADIPFQITAEATGEIRIVRTDSQGGFSSAAVSHSFRTNGGQAGDGLWFEKDRAGNTVPVSDDRGALPYGRYTLTELACEANADKILYSGSFTITESAATVDIGTIRNKTKQLPPEIDTVLTAADGSHTGIALRNVILTDRISYRNLRPGKTYQINSRLLDAETGEPVMSEGKPVTVFGQFTPSAGEGSIPVKFEFSAAGLEGTTVAACEEILLDGKVIAEHADLQDKDQQVVFPWAELTVTKSIDAEELSLWRPHGDPVFQVQVSGTGEDGRAYAFVHTFCFTEEYVRQNASEGRVVMSHTFRNLPVSAGYRIEELQVSRYSLESMSGNGSHVTASSGNAGTGFCERTATADLTRQLKGTEIVLENEKTNYRNLNHTAYVENVIRE
jgi:hypothetical protein